MKNINYKKAKDFKPGETVRDLGISFIVKEVHVIGKPGLISFLDTEDVWHGTYHPHEYFAAGEELACKYAATYNRQIEEEIYRLPNMPRKMIPYPPPGYVEEGNIVIDFNGNGAAGRFLPRKPPLKRSPLICRCTLVD